MTSPFYFVGPAGKMFMSNYKCKDVVTEAMEYTSGFLTEIRNTGNRNTNKS